MFVVSLVFLNIQFIFAKPNEERERYMKIGQKIKELRILNGLTQSELADRSELTKGFISQVERDLTSPSIATLTDILQALGIPFAYDHFAEGESPEPPFICYLLPASDNFAADGQVYFKATEVHIELYTDTKDVGLEASVEAVLDEHDIFYDKSEVWIESERLYEVLYSFEMEV